MTESIKAVKPRKKKVIPAERALIVTEQEPEVIPEPVVVEPVAPKTFELYPLTEDGVVPNSKSPYYPQAKEGLYLYRPLLIGHGYIPQKDWPKSIRLKSIGQSPAGMFTWVGPPIPADICAQIVHLFRRILTKQRTEAEVLLLLNHKTMEWKIWIPTQEVSYSGVTSVYEPSQIPKDFVVVGSMHSHCDFGAFHSGTDTGDARQFDGIHLTIGKLDEEIPEVAAMVMMNKVQFDYKDVSMVADFSNLEAATAPEFWDEFIGIKGSEPRGHELFEKYKPTVYTTYTPYTWTPNKDNSKYTGGLTDEEWSSYFNGRQHKGSEDGWKKIHAPGYVNKSKNPSYLQDTKKRDRLFDEDYWEDDLPNNIADVILRSNVLTEKDIDYATDNPYMGSSPLFWRNLFLSKLANVAITLAALGITVNYEIDTKPPVKEK